MDDYTRKQRFNEADRGQEKLGRTLETLKSDVDKYIVPRPSSPERIKNSIKDATWGKKQAETRKREHDEEKKEIQNRILDAFKDGEDIQRAIGEHAVPGVITAENSGRAKEAIKKHLSTITELKTKMGMRTDV